MGRPSSTKAPKSAAPDDPFSPTLRAWFRDNGIVWSGLRFERAEGRGVFGVATSDIEPGHAVIAVPKAAMLTHRNAADAPALGTLLELGLPSVEVLALAIALERRAGKSSPWHPYLQSLPKAEPLPLLWSASELRCLAGTGLDGVSRRRRRRLLSNHHVAVAEWPGATQLPSAGEYLAASTLSSSRAFRVDEVHGEGLLPLCDLLNHKAALVPGHGGGGGGGGLEGEDDEEGEGEEESEGEEEGEEEEGEEEGLLVRNYDRRRGGWLRRDVSLRIPPPWLGLGLANPNPNPNQVSLRIPPAAGNEEAEAGGDEESEGDGGDSDVDEDGDVGYVGTAQC